MRHLPVLSSRALRARMLQTAATAALLLIAGAGVARAQYYVFPHEPRGYYESGRAYRGSGWGRESGPALSPREVVSIVRQEGYRAAGRPVWMGRIYRVDAVDPNGNLVQLRVDADLGDILGGRLIRRADHPRRAPREAGLQPERLPHEPDLRGRMSAKPPHHLPPKAAARKPETKPKAVARETPPPAPHAPEPGSTHPVAPLPPPAARETAGKPAIDKPAAATPSGKDVPRQAVVTAPPQPGTPEHPGAGGNMTPVPPPHAGDAARKASGTPETVGAAPATAPGKTPAETAAVNPAPMAPAPKVEKAAPLPKADKPAAAVPEKMAPETAAVKPAEVPPAAAAEKAIPVPPAATAPLPKPAIGETTKVRTEDQAVAKAPNTQLGTGTAAAPRKIEMLPPAVLDDAPERSSTPLISPAPGK